ncbi:MAG: UDP-N-acetylenolpyruvoylglucosamine reductase [Candidatus Pacebacteria bacterium CG10_big_fil_rev_8_21_14_0_10_56_10]|nr:MAG: UDP-N-acetylenolpyruvoylglucosamine reductase [Candidatus Pacebacteria bacterium CG10_big_fil_rev_8_21_14_0_10_56_10]
MTLAQQLSSHLPGITFQPEVPLAPMTYFKIGGPAEAFAKINQPDRLPTLSAYCAQQQIPLTVLGGASNVIVADQGVRGLIIRLTNDEVSLSDSPTGSTLTAPSPKAGQPTGPAPSPATDAEPSPTTRQPSKQLTAGAGARTALLVKAAIDAGLTGLEQFLGVPGTVGGAIYNNAHYLQNLIGRHIRRVQVVTTDHRLSWLWHDDCRFGYDSSRFQTSREIIVRAEFELAMGNRQRSEQLIAAATRYRAQTQPLGEPSSGCIFQNVKLTPQLAAEFPQFTSQGFVPSGYLIDQAGLKGTTVGGVTVSPKHAAFFINSGGGTARDAKQLVALVKAKVKTKFGVELQEEVFYLGQDLPEQS